MSLESQTRLASTTSIRTTYFAPVSLLLGIFGFYTVSFLFSLLPKNPLQNYILGIADPLLTIALFFALLLGYRFVEKKRNPYSEIILEDFVRSLIFSKYKFQILSFLLLYKLSFFLFYIFSSYQSQPANSLYFALEYLVYNLPIFAIAYISFAGFLPFVRNKTYQLSARLSTFATLIVFIYGFMAFTNCTPNNDKDQANPLLLGLLAGNQGVISGQVGTTGIADAKIELRNIGEDTLLATAIADSSGKFIISSAGVDLEKGYELKAIYETTVGELKFSDSFYAYYPGGEKLAESHITGITSTAYHLASSVEGSTFKEKHEKAVGNMVSIGMVRKDDWSGSQPELVSKDHLGLQKHNLGTWSKMIAHDLKNGDLSGSHAQIFPNAHGGILSIDTGLLNNSLSIFPGLKTETTISIQKSNPDLVVRLFLEKAVSGVTLDSNNKLTIVADELSEAGKIIPVTLIAQSPNSKYSRKLTINVFKVKDPSVVTKEVSSSGGIVNDGTDDITLNIPPNTFPSGQSLKIHKGLGVDGRMVYVVEGQDDLGDVKVFIPGIKVQSSENKRALNDIFLPSYLETLKICQKSKSINKLTKYYIGKNANSKKYFKFLGTLHNDYRSVLCSEENIHLDNSAINVIFIHGYTIGTKYGGGDGTWYIFPQVIQSNLEVNLNRNINLFEFHWRTDNAFDLVAEDLAGAINYISANTNGGKVHIIAHSFGGLLARAYLQSNINPKLNSFTKPIKSFITISTPHSGIFLKDNDFPIGQDEFMLNNDPEEGIQSAFAACKQLSCYQAGFTSNFSKGGYENEDLKNDLIDQDSYYIEVGSFIRKLSKYSVNPFPKNLPIKVIIGRKSHKETCKSSDGDGLISLLGQRFIPNKNYTEPLNNDIIGTAFIKEVLLTDEDNLNDCKGYTHTSAFSRGSWSENNPINSSTQAMQEAFNTIYAVEKNSPSTTTASRGPRIVASNSFFTFTDQYVDTTGSMPTGIKVSNTGDSDLTTNVQITGANPDDFYIINAPKDTITLQPGDSTEIPVKFKPTSEGAKHANLTITSNDPQNDVKTIPLTGKAVVEADVSRPYSTSIRINNNSASTTSTGVTLNLSAKDNIGITAYYASNASVTPAATAVGWIQVEKSQDLSMNVSYTLPGSLIAGTFLRTVYVWFKDGAGNVSSRNSDSISLVISDVTKPTLSSFSINNNAGSTTTTSVSLNSSASDNIKVTQFYASESSAVPGAGAIWYSYAPSVAFSLNPATSPGNYTRRVYFWVRDAAGNLSSARSDTITLSVSDTEKPLIKSFSINNNAAKAASTSVILNINASDNVAISHYYASENPTDPDSTGWNTYTSAPGFNLSTGNGTKTVYLWVRDAAGNISAIKDDSILLDIVDNTRPVINSFSIAGNASVTTNTRVTLSLSASDASGVSHYYASESSTTPNASYPWQAYTSYPSFTLRGESSPGDYPRTVYVWAKDNAGNISAIKSDSITLRISDTQAPTINSFSINNGSSDTTSTSVTLNLSASDNVGVRQYYASENNYTPSSSSEWRNYSTSPSFTLSSSSSSTYKYVYVWVRDAAGHVSSVKSDSIYYKVSDTQKPYSTSVSINSGASTTTSTTVSLSLRAYDNVGIVCYTVKDVYDYYPSCQTNVSSTTSFSKTVNHTIAFTSSGTKRVHVWYFDAAGNYAYTSDTIELQSGAKITETTTGPYYSAYAPNGKRFVYQAIYNSSLVSSNTVRIRVKNTDGSKIGFSGWMKLYVNGNYAGGKSFSANQYYSLDFDYTLNSIGSEYRFYVIDNYDYNSGNIKFKRNY